MTGNTRSVSATTAFFIALRLFYRRLGIFLVANIFWILASLPLLTLPAATGALFYMAHRVVLEERQRDPHYARPGDFWAGFRRYAWRSTGLFLLQLLTLAVILISLRFYGQSPLPWMRWLLGPVILFLIAWFCVQLYAFPLLILYPDRGAVAALRRAFRYFLVYPLYSLLLVVWMLILTVICVLLAGPVFLVLFSLLALIPTMALRVLRVIEGDVEPPELEEG